MQILRQFLPHFVELFRLYESLASIVFLLHREVRHELEIAELPGNVHSRTQGAKLTIDCTTIRSIGFSLIDVCLQNASSDALDLVSGKESVQVHQPPNI